MDHEATARRFSDLTSSGDIEGLGAAMADDFVEHEETPGLVPTKEGILEDVRTYRAALPDMHMEPEDVLVSRDKVVVRSRATGTMVERSVVPERGARPRTLADTWPGHRLTLWAGRAWGGCYRFPPCGGQR